MTTASASSARQGSWWPSTDGLHIVALCTGVSMALHALLLTLHLPSSGPPAERLQYDPGSHDSMRVRVIGELLVASGSAPSTVATTSTRAKGPRASAIRASSAESLPSLVPKKENGPHAALQPQVQQPPEGNAGRSAGSSTTTPMLPGNAGDNYVPRPLLSIPPVAKQAVLLTAPPSAAVHGRYVGVLSLFIDEQGQVQHITFDKPSLPEAFERAAREAFLTIQFSPGEIDGATVKSRLRVEVVFDDTPVLDKDSR